MPYIREKFDIEDVMFASPDMGGSKRAGMYAKTLNNSFVICYKHRNKPNEIGEMRLIGDVEGKHVILLDDIIDTGSTICKAAGIIKQSGAKSVRAMITHPVLSGNAIEKVEARPAPRPLSNRLRPKPSAAWSTTRASTTSTRPLCTTRVSLNV